MSWSKWKDIEQKADYKGCGVYKIRLADSNKKPIEIHRFLGHDNEGILQIGRSTNIERRIGYFHGAMKGKNYAHAEGERLNYIIENTCFLERYKDCNVQYSFKKLENEREVKAEEKHLLIIYFKIFGEVPPLNNNLPGRN
jgi:hypothetical protein